jgi:hypothetical protein
MAIYAFDEISEIHGDHLPTYNRIGFIFIKVIVRALGAQTRNIDFVAICFTIRTDLIVVRFSVTSEIIDFVPKVA